MINHKHKFIFIHIPKTGGLTITRQFQKKIIHKTALEQRKLSPEIWDEYYKFAFVRSPWSYLVSRYFFARLKHRKGKRGYRTAVDMKFDRWVRWFIDIKKDDLDGYEPKYYRPLIEWVTDKKGNVIVDYVGRTEGFHKHWMKVCKDIGLKASRLPRKNTTSHRHYSTYYTDDLRDAVADYFAPDLKAFKYKFTDKRQG